MKKHRRLGDLKKGDKAMILSVGVSSDETPINRKPKCQFSERLLEMGLLEGSVVEVMHEAPFGGDPFAIKVRGTLLALQRELANSIEVLVYGPENTQ